METIYEGPYFKACKDMNVGKSTNYMFNIKVVFVICALLISSAGLQSQTVGYYFGYHIENPPSLHSLMNRTEYDKIKTIDTLMGYLKNRYPNVIYKVTLHQINTISFREAYKKITIVPNFFVAMYLINCVILNDSNFVKSLDPMIVLNDSTYLPVEFYRFKKDDGEVISVINGVTKFKSGHVFQNKKKHKKMRKAYFKWYRKNKLDLLNTEKSQCLRLFFDSEENKRVSIYWRSRK